MQFADFNTEPSKEDTEYAKWEGYEALVLKMRRQVATVDSLDGAEVGDDEEFDDVEATPWTVDFSGQSKKMSN